MSLELSTRGTPIFARRLRWLARRGLGLFSFSDGLVERDHRRVFGEFADAVYAIGRASDRPGERT